MNVNMVRSPLKEKLMNLSNKDDADNLQRMLKP